MQRGVKQFVETRSQFATSVFIFLNALLVFEAAAVSLRAQPAAPVTAVESDPSVSPPAEATGQAATMAQPEIAPPASMILDQTFCEPCCIELSPVARVLGEDWLTRSNLMGNALGIRPALAEDGISVDGNVTQFYQGVASGGRQQEFVYGGHSDTFVNLDGQKLGWGEGLVVTLHVETVFGQSANSLTGGLLPASMIQAVPVADGSATALTGVKVTKILSENWVTYFGKLNTLDDFKQPFAAGRGVDAFMNAGFLFNPVLARTIPYSSFGAGAAYLQEGQPVASLSIFDTNNNPTSSGFNTFFDNGVSVIGQVNVPTHFADLPGHQGVGFTYSSGHYSSLDRSSFLNGLITGNKAMQTGSQSVFYSFDQTLVSDPEDPTKSWGLFGNAGLADSNPSPLNWFANIGVGGSSLVHGRPLDTFGVGYYYLGVSSSLKDLAPVLLPIGNEQGVELFYNYAVTPWFRLTPDLQIVNPALSKFDTSVTFGLRAKINF